MGKDGVGQLRGADAHGSDAVAALVAELRRRGGRVTPQRQMILEAICEHADHVTAELIAKQVRARWPGINISTVYRNLQLLEDMGVIGHVHFGHSVARYHPSSDRSHQHLVCRVCSRIQDVGIGMIEPLQRRLMAEHGFQLDPTHFALYGTCSSCRSAEPMVEGLHSPSAEAT